MLVAFASRTGNVRRFVTKLGVRTVQIAEEMRVDEPFILVTYTTGFGEVPRRVTRFLQQNSALLVGVAASGNRNWGETFCGSADVIARTYDVPIISKFELSGTERDVNSFLERAEALWPVGILS